MYNSNTSNASITSNTRNTPNPRPRGFLQAVRRIHGCLFRSNGYMVENALRETSCSVIVR